ncbi:MAG: hypothetical protein NC300_05050 [Bacteroidales bacterium]|nr:hypothetical protein [Clostridium sp.]MCM1203490.1 hypothetical protein [Bacteroidales bacterium]
MRDKKQKMGTGKRMAGLPAMVLAAALLLSGCGGNGRSIMPIVDITMNSTNAELKEAYGEKYQDSGYGDGETTISVKAGDDTDVTVHVNWNEDTIKNIWLEAVVDKEHYSDFEKQITDFYSDLELQNQADVVENGSTRYKDVDISYIHFIDQGNVFLYVGNEEEEKEEASAKAATEDTAAE